MFSRGTLEELALQESGVTLGLKLKKALVPFSAPKKQRSRTLIAHSFTTLPTGALTNFALSLQLVLLVASLRPGMELSLMGLWCIIITSL